MRTVTRKMLFYMTDVFAGIFFLLLRDTRPCAAESKGDRGTICRVTSTIIGNKSSQASEWCTTGCCQFDAVTVRCCGDKRLGLSDTMIYGIAVTAILVLLIMCIYVRMRYLASIKPRQRPSHPAQEHGSSFPDAEQAVERAVAMAPPALVQTPDLPPSLPPDFPLDLPPPYWACVAADPPANVIHATTSSAITSSQTIGYYTYDAGPYYELEGTSAKEDAQ